MIRCSVVNVKAWKCHGQINARRVAAILFVLQEVQKGGLDDKILEEGKRGVQTTSDRTLKRKKFDQWPPYAARRNLIQVNTKYTCAVLHKDFEPRRQLEPKGVTDGA